MMMGLLDRARDRRSDLEGTRCRTMMQALAVLLMCFGCRADFQLGPSAERGARPRADAGTGTTIRLENSITLDGSGSIDPDGNIVAYRWMMVAGPPDSTAAIVDGDAAVAMFTPDVVGVFTFQLEISDDDGHSDVSSVIYLVTPAPLTVKAGSDFTIEWRKVAQLTGAVGAASQELPAVTWSFVARPARSLAVLQNATTLTPSFVADAAGTYVVELTATTSQHTRTDSVEVVAAPIQVPFDGAFIDAVVSADTDSDGLIAISDAPPRIRFIEVATGTETSIALPSTPTALAMDVNENTLAVATAGQVTIVNVFTRTITGSFNVPVAISHIVVDRLGRIHCFPTQAGPTHSFDPSTAVVAPGPTVSGGMIARDQPGTSNIYGVDTTVTPADLYHFYGGSAPLEYVSDSPYAGEYPMGGNLWLVYDSIVVRGGSVFQTSPFGAMDMSHRGQLGGDQPATTEWAMAYGGKIITLHAMSAPLPPNDQLRFFDLASLTLLDAAPVPELVVNGTPQRSIGRLLGYSPSFPNKVVLVVSAGTSNAFIVTDP